MTTAIRIARRWHEWKLNEQRILRTLDCYELQKQVGKFRERHPECREWRWRTKTIQGGMLVQRVK